MIGQSGVGRLQINLAGGRGGGVSTLYLTRFHNHALTISGCRPLSWAPETDNCLWQSLALCEWSFVTLCPSAIEAQTVGGGSFEKETGEMLKGKYCVSGA